MVIRRGCWGLSIFFPYMVISFVQLLMLCENGIYRKNKNTIDRLYRKAILHKLPFYQA